MSIDALEAMARRHAQLLPLLALEPAERAAALARIPDRAARVQLEALLARRDTPLDRPLAELAAPLLDVGSMPMSMPAVGDAIGAWRILAPLGEGGMARVHLVQRRQGPEQRAALKTLRREYVSPALRARFEHEQRILARLEHPGIARLIDAGVSADGEPYLVAEFVDGLSIRRWCEQTAADVRARIAVFMRVLEAVQYAHRHLVVHRDLKPDNILVDGQGQPRLLDFGIARLLDPDDGDAADATRSLMLTPEYAAPEQFRGERASTAADIYSLGVVLYELLAGCRPRDAGAAPDAPPNALPSRQPGSIVPRAMRGDLDAIVMKALALAPGARYVSAHAFAADLACVLRGEAISLREGQWSYRLGRILRRHWLVAALAGLSVVALLIAAIGASGRARDAEQARAQIERELRRANDLQGFLYGLFRAADPTRPAAERVSIEDLLDDAGERAMTSGGDPDVRVDFLAALIRLETARHRLPQARRLADAALELLDRGGIADASAARALVAVALLGVESGESEPAPDRLLQRAARHAAADPSARHVRWQVGAARAGIAFSRSRHADILAELAPLQDALDGDPLISDEERFNVLSMQSYAFNRLGRFDDARAAFDRQLALPLLRESVNDRRRAITLSNSMRTELALGHFDVAIERAHQALPIHDAISSEPRPERAATRIGLGEVWLARGQLHRALAEFDRGNAEWARVRGLASADDYAYTHFNRGFAWLSAQRWAEAEAALTRARDLLAPIAAERKLNMLQLGHGIARAQCAQGEHAAARDGLDRALALAEELGDNATPERAELHESAAVCAEAGGHPDAAIAAIERALHAGRSAGPGFAGIVARRELLRAALLAARGDAGGAADARRNAREALLAVGLNDHPLLPAATPSPR